MKLKKMEDQSVGTSEKGNKILKGAVMEIKCRAVMERKAIQRLYYQG